MATISYRPELENPSRDAALAFSYNDTASQAIRTLTLKPGVNRHVDETAWTVIKETPTIQALLRIKALEVLGSEVAAEETLKGDSPQLADVVGLPVVEAFKVIEQSFDEEFLQAWKRAEGRTTVLNKINQRLQRLRTGEG